MQSARLDMALATQAWVLPGAGDIAVLRPRAGDDLGALPKARVEIDVDGEAADDADATA
jgi:16S rRNA (guanine1207-N2)-methyltransferase